MNISQLQTAKNLLYKHLQGTLSEEEEAQLQHWLAESAQNGELFDRISNSEQLENDLVTMYAAQRNTLAKLREAIPEIRPTSAPDPHVYPLTHRIHFLRTAWFKYAAAAIIILSLGAYLWSTYEKNNPGNAKSNSFSKNNDVMAPSLNRATITLASGEQIGIDNVGFGTLANQGTIQIEKMQDGRIVYKGTGEQTVQYNTLTVPRGSKMASIVLSDGTKVSLNAASSITYPVAFTQQTREVSVTGEVYFEVAKDPKKKFIVSSSGMETEVLGTHFNINAYPDEKVRSVTLLEGRGE